MTKSALSYGKVNSNVKSKKMRQLSENKLLTKVKKD